jgi:hypothetical protein
MRRIARSANVTGWGASVGITALALGIIIGFWAPLPKMGPLEGTTPDAAPTTETAPAPAPDTVPAPTPAPTEATPPPAPAPAPTTP